MIALVLGASGTTGQELLKQLLTNEKFKKVKVLNRKTLNVSSEKLEEYLVSDFLSISEDHPAFQADVIFCCLGSTLKKSGSREAFRHFDYETVLHLAKMAHRKKVGKFILVSASGANQNSSFFYNKVKGELEVSLQNLNFKNLVIMRPALLIAERAEFRLAEKMAISIFCVLSFFLPKALSRRVGTAVPRLATRMVELAEQKTPPLMIVHSAQI